MNFTYDSYRHLIGLLSENGYKICDYDNYNGISGRRVILRHDIDNSIEKAVSLSDVERKLGGGHSTFFVLLTSDFYNVFSLKSLRGLDKILDNGSVLGLHFDEMRYPDEAGNPKKITDRILQERDLLEQALGIDIHTVSMHRPSQEIIKADLHIPGMINSYSGEFFSGFKYVSDSRRRWREPVEDIIRGRQYDKLHILTHAFWYNDAELDITESVSQFVNHANYERYSSMADNITDIGSIMSEENVR